MPKSDERYFYPTHCPSVACQGNTPLKEGRWIEGLAGLPRYNVCHVCKHIVYRIDKNALIDEPPDYIQEILYRRNPNSLVYQALVHFKIGR